MSTEKEVDRLEHRLAGTLRPIAPRREFVHGLGNRIRGFRRVVLDASANTWQFVLLVVAGFISLGLLFALLGRALTYLFGGGKRETERA